MKILILLLSFGLQTLTVRCQSLEFYKTGTWRIYYLTEKNRDRFVSDSLPGIKSDTIERAAMQPYLGALSPLPASDSLIWMGYYFASCDSAGVVHRVAVSRYGGFLYDVDRMLYFRIPEELTVRWLTFWSERYRTVRQLWRVKGDE